MHVNGTHHQTGKQLHPMSGMSSHRNQSSQDKAQVGAVYDAIVRRLASAKQDLRDRLSEEAAARRRVFASMKQVAILEAKLASATPPPLTPGSARSGGDRGGGGRQGSSGGGGACSEAPRRRQPKPQSQHRDHAPQAQETAREVRVKREDYGVSSEHRKGQRQPKQAVRSEVDEMEQEEGEVGDGSSDEAIEEGHQDNQVELADSDAQTDDSDGEASEDDDDDVDDDEGLTRTQREQLSIARVRFAKLYGGDPRRLKINATGNLGRRFGDDSQYQTVCWVRPNAEHCKHARCTETKFKRIFVCILTAL